MWRYKTPGVPDEFFVTRGGVPGPTKEEIRVITISKARLREGGYVIDVGCGVGSLTVEAALIVGPAGKVFALDEDVEAVEATRLNVARFGVQDHVHVIHGKAPEALKTLPQVDSVIVGGSRSLAETLEAACEKLKAGGRLVVNAVTLETAYEVVKKMRELGLGELDLTLVFVAKGRFVEAGTMMLSRNPIFVVSATKV